ncbi:aldo/keto reductase [Ornithinicoccus halotolerans]|uniref:aldo/keto reductase n=1 Tax=Ornithinicoccus halotolerans TaxID=1748220 RepID=UPI001297CB41|nr:aldo/keto reductase [Ornithinicoccus halotolerans]
METVQLAGLERPWSRVVLGTMTFGDTADAREAAAMVEAALEAGITSLDTANVYAGGETERILADILRDRDDVLLATKAGMPHPDAGDHAPLSAAGLRACLEASLRRLGRDRVDLFYLHKPDRDTPVTETMATLADLVGEGRVGAVGVSNHAAWQIADVNAVADQAGCPRPVVAQQLYNVVGRRLEEEYAEFAATTGLHTVAYNPLAGGLLTGRYQPDEEPVDGRFGSSAMAERYRDRYWNQQTFAAVAELTRVAEEAGLSLVELSLRWLLGRPATGSVLIGSSRTAQLRQNLDALARGPLPEDVQRACDDVGDRLRGPMPRYNR